MLFFVIDVGFSWRAADAGRRVLCRGSSDKADPERRQIGWKRIISSIEFYRNHNNLMNFPFGLRSYHTVCLVNWWKQRVVFRWLTARHEYFIIFQLYLLPERFEFRLNYRFLFANASFRSGACDLVLLSANIKWKHNNNKNGIGKAVPMPKWKDTKDGKGCIVCIVKVVRGEWKYYCKLFWSH